MTRGSVARRDPHKVLGAGPASGLPLRGDQEVPVNPSKGGGRLQGAPHTALIPSYPSAPPNPTDPLPSHTLPHTPHPPPPYTSSNTPIPHSPSSLPATQFGQVLLRSDTSQQEMAGALKHNSVLLAEVGPSNTHWDGVEYFRKLDIQKCTGTAGRHPRGLRDLADGRCTSQGPAAASPPLEKAHATACAQGVSLQEFLDWKNWQEKNIEIILV